MLDLTHPEIAAQARRITAFTVALARALGLPGGRIRIIARGAFLHDAGMAAVPAAIVNKPGPLTHDETISMRDHCFAGYKVLRSIPFLSEASETVNSHHERYDGKGYPRGLKGEEIPLGARILAVADTFDAIVYGRPYREAESIDEARREIERCKGSQFDPEVVSVFLTVPEKIWRDLGQEILFHANSGRTTTPP